MLRVLPPTALLGGGWHGEYMHEAQEALPMECLYLLLSWQTPCGGVLGPQGAEGPHGPRLLLPALQPEVGSQAGRSPLAVVEVLGHLGPLWTAMGVPS